MFVCLSVVSNAHPHLWADPDETLQGGPVGPSGGQGGPGVEPPDGAFGGWVFAISKMM